MKEKMDNDFLVNRSLFNHWLWEKKPFSWGQAWIDLIGLANHDDHKIPLGNGMVIDGKRGDVNRSIKFLAERWGWNRRTVKRYLLRLENDEMVTVKCTTKYTIITIANYDLHQLKPSSNAQPNTQQGAQQSNNCVHNRVTHTKKVKDLVKKGKQLYYGEFQNVKLSDAEFEKLKTKFPDSFEERIEKLSSYMASKGKSYKSHYATILTWARKETNGNERIKSRVAEDSGQVEDYSGIFIDGA